MILKYLCCIAADVRDAGAGLGHLHDGHFHIIRRASVGRCVDDRDDVHWAAAVDQLLDRRENVVTDAILKHSRDHSCDVIPRAVRVHQRRAKKRALRCLLAGQVCLLHRSASQKISDVGVRPDLTRAICRVGGALGRGFIHKIIFQGEKPLPPS